MQENVIKLKLVRKTNVCYLRIIQILPQISSVVDHRVLMVPFYKYLFAFAFAFNLHGKPDETECICRSNHLLKHSGTGIKSASRDQCQKPERGSGERQTGQYRQNVNKQETNMVKTRNM